MRKELVVLVCVCLMMTTFGCVDNVMDLSIAFSPVRLEMVEEGGTYTLNAESTIDEIDASKDEPLRWKDFFFSASDVDDREVIPKVPIEGPEAASLPGLHIIKVENVSGKGRIDVGDKIRIVGLDEKTRVLQFDLETDMNKVFIGMANIHMYVSTFDFEIVKIEPWAWGSVSLLNITSEVEGYYLTGASLRWDLTTLELSDQNYSNNMTLALEPPGAEVRSEVQAWHYDGDLIGDTMEGGDTIVLTRVPMLYLNGFIHISHPGLGVFTGRRIPWDPFYEDHYH